MSWAGSKAKAAHMNKAAVAAASLPAAIVSEADGPAVWSVSGAMAAITAALLAAALALATFALAATLAAGAPRDLRVRS